MAKINHHLGLLLRIRREQLGLSQGDFAKRINALAMSMYPDIDVTLAQRGIAFLESGRGMQRRKIAPIAVAMAMEADPVAFITLAACGDLDLEDLEEVTFEELRDQLQNAAGPRRRALEQHVADMYGSLRRLIGGQVDAQKTLGVPGLDLEKLSAQVADTNLAELTTMMIELEARERRLEERQRKLDHDFATGVDGEVDDGASRVKGIGGVTPTLQPVKS